MKTTEIERYSQSNYMYKDIKNTYCKDKYKDLFCRNCYVKDLCYGCILDLYENNTFTKNIEECKM